jgi:hypothetical protein
MHAAESHQMHSSANHQIQAYLRNQMHAAEVIECMPQLVIERMSM